MRKVLSFLALGLMAIFIFGCGDMEGETGPQGPPGVPCDACIDTASIIPGAVTSYWQAEGRGDIQTSGTWALMPDMELNITTSGGPVLIVFNASFRAETGGVIHIRLLIDDQAVDQKIGGSSNTFSAFTISLSRIVELSPGDHKVRIEWGVSGAFPGTITQSNGARVLTVIELKR